jgi:signal transduction histidine kinase
MAQPFLQTVNISKRYGGVEALLNVNLAIYPGEVIGLVGDTNSGKSTLLNLLAGSLWPDTGHFVVEGKRAKLNPSHRAARLGIKAVHQEINAAEHMNALGYIFASQAPIQHRVPLRWLGWVDRDSMREKARDEFYRLGFDPPELDCPLHDLTSAQRKMVVFVHATIGSPRLLLLDEPMDSLETYKLRILRLIERFREKGGAVLLVTQNLENVFGIADRIVVLNAGAKIAERRTTDTTEEEIVRLILGTAEDSLTPAVWALSNYFEVRRQAEALDKLNKAYERRAARLQAHVEVARSITSILDRERLLLQIAQIIQQRFGYYYTGIFLKMADGESVELRSSASRNDEHLSLGNLRLHVDESSMIGWCAANGKAHLANDMREDKYYLPDITLPETRAELVVPLRIGERVLGVLDLQSDKLSAFDEEDVLALQGLADQLAIAIRNADLFEAAQEARRQADEANRYKSVFLSNMSHELRTPLSVIIEHTQAMLSPTHNIYTTPLPEEYANDLETVCKNGEHLLALISDILDLSKIEGGQLRLRPRVIDLASIFDDALRIAGGLLKGKPITLRRDFPADLPPAWGDRVRMQQIMINLISNAIKFTERGSITVSATTDAAASATQQKGKIVVSVTDTGIGIPEHLQKVIFNRFRQGHNAASKKYGGAGLGLSISQQLVELQGGRIWVESRVGQGSTISFTVPVTTPEQIAAHSDSDESLFYDARRMVVFQDPEEAPAANGVKLILHAQEENAVAYALRAALQDEGYIVEPALPNESLLEMAELLLPDLIVFDVHDTAEHTLAHTLLCAASIAHIPVVVLGSEGVVCPAGRSAPVHYLSWDHALVPSAIQLVRDCLKS